MWNKVVLCPNSSDRSLIGSEKSKSVVFWGNMKSTNLLCSIFPSFLNSRCTFFFFFTRPFFTDYVENIFIAPVKCLERFVVLWYVFECFNLVINCTLGKYRVLFRVFEPFNEFTSNSSRCFCCSLVFCSVN